MTDIAALGLAVDARPVSAAAVELDRLTKASAGARAEAGRLKSATADTGSALGAQAAAMDKVSASVASFERQARTASAGLDKFGRSTATAGTTMGITANQARNLSFQINDVFTSLASGAPAMQVLAQQGGQIYQALGEGPKGVTGSLKAIGSTLLRLVTPATVFGGTIAAVGAGAAIAYGRWEAAQESLAKSLDGIGRGAGVTLAQLNQVSEAGARAAGISNSDARGLAAGYARTGRIGPEMMTGLIGSSKAYARVTGQDLPAAGAELAKAFEDPSKGLDILNGRLGIFDARTQAAIRSMQEQGNLVGAQQGMRDKLNADLATSTDRTWTLTKAWDGLKASISNGADAVGQAVQSKVDPTLDQRISELQQRVSQPKRIFGGVNSPLGGAGVQAELNELLRQRDERDKTAAEKAAEIARAAKSNELKATVRGASPEQTQLQTLQNQYKSLQDALKENVPTENMDQLNDAFQRVGASIRSMTGAQEGADLSRAKLISQSELVRQRLDLEIRSINARTAAEKAAIAVEQQRLARFGQPAPTAQEEGGIRAAIFAQARRDAEDQLKTANDNLALAGLPSYQRSRLEIDQRAKDAQKAAQGSDAGGLIEQRRLAEIAALNRTAIQQPIEDANRSIREQASLLEVQARTFGMSTKEVASATEYQKLLNTAVQNGITVGPGLASSYRSIADATGRLAEASEKLAEAQQKVVDTMDNLRGASNDVFGGFASDIAHGNSAKTALSNLGGRLGDRLIGMGSGTITDSLFGKSGKPGGGMFGDAIGQFIGQGVGLPDAAKNVSSLKNSLANMTVGTASITSGSVVVNGGVGGGLGGAAGAASGSGGMSSVLSLSKSYEGLNEKTDTSTISSILSASGTAQLDPKSQAWCAAYANAVLAKSGLSGTGSNLASSFQNWGQETKTPGLGDIVNLKPQAAGSSGHVGFFGGYDNAGNVLVSGGNQGDSVKTSSFPVDQVVSFRTALTDASKSTENFGSSLNGISKSFESTVGAATNDNGGGGLFGALGSLFKGGSPGTVGSTTGAALGFAGEFAGGGRIRGPGSGTSDSIIARVSNGEGIIPAAQMAKHGPLVDAIISDRLPRFAEGRGTGDTIARDFSAGRQIGGGGGMAVTIGGNTTSIIVQGGADNNTLGQLQSELDRRDAANDAKMEQKLRRTFGAYQKTYAGNRG